MPKPLTLRDRMLERARRFAQDRRVTDDKSALVLANENPFDLFTEIGLDLTKELSDVDLARFFAETGREFYYRGNRNLSLTSETISSVFYQEAMEFKATKLMRSIGNPDVADCKEYTVRGFNEVRSLVDGISVIDWMGRRFFDGMVLVLDAASKDAHSLEFPGTIVHMRTRSAMLSDWLKRSATNLDYSLNRANYKFSAIFAIRGAWEYIERIRCNVSGEPYIYNLDPEWHPQILPLTPQRLIKEVTTVLGKRAKVSAVSRMVSEEMQRYQD